MEPTGQLPAKASSRDFSNTGCLSLATHRRGRLHVTRECWTRGRALREQSDYGEGSLWEQTGDHFFPRSSRIFFLIWKSLVTYGAVQFYQNMTFLTVFMSQKEARPYVVLFYIYAFLKRLP